MTPSPRMNERFEIQMGTESMLRDMVDMEERRREKAEAELALLREEYEQMRDDRDERWRRMDRIAALCDRAAQQGLIGFPDQVRAALRENLS